MGSGFGRSCGMGTSRAVASIGETDASAMDCTLSRSENVGAKRSAASGRSMCTITSSATLQQANPTPAG